MYKPLCLLLSVLFLSFSTNVDSKTRYEGQYAQLTQPQQEFIQKHSSCCSVADGTFAEDSWRPDGTYVTFQAIVLDSQGNPSGVEDVPWTKVPSYAIINEPNPFGRPVVWYYKENGVYQIRCYVPGPGI